MIEWVSLAAMIVSVAGVVCNNRRMRACFALWLVSNSLSLGVHAADGLVWMSTRDAIFIVLAVEGWVRWGRAKPESGARKPERT